MNYEYDKLLPNATLQRLKRLGERRSFWKKLQDILRKLLGKDGQE